MLRERRSHRHCQNQLRMLLSLSQQLKIKVDQGMVQDWDLCGLLIQTVEPALTSRYHPERRCNKLCCVFVSICKIHFAISTTATSRRDGKVMHINPRHAFSDGRLPLVQTFCSPTFRVGLNHPLVWRESPSVSAIPPPFTALSQSFSSFPLHPSAPVDRFHLCIDAPYHPCQLSPQSRHRGGQATVRKGSGYVGGTMSHLECVCACRG